MALSEAHRVSTHAQARLSAGLDDRLSRFIIVLRRYFPLLHPSLVGPAHGFPQLVDTLWDAAVRSNPNTAFVDEKRQVLGGIASHVARRALWTAPDIKRFLLSACGLEFYHPDVLLVLDGDSLQVNPSEAVERVEIAESLWLISSILRTTSNERPVLEPLSEGPVDWVPYRPLREAHLRPPNLRSGNILAQNSCFFRQDTNTSNCVFHRTIEPVALIGDDASRAGPSSSLDQMMQYADVGTGKDTVRTRVAYFIGKIMAFRQLGDSVSLASCGPVPVIS